MALTDGTVSGCDDGGGPFSGADRVISIDPGTGLVSQLESGSSAVFVATSDPFVGTAAVGEDWFVALVQVPGGWPEVGFDAGGRTSSGWHSLCAGCDVPLAPMTIPSASVIRVDQVAEVDAIAGAACGRLDGAGAVAVASCEASPVGIGSMEIICPTGGCTDQFEIRIDFDVAPSPGWMTQFTMVGDTGTVICQYGQINGAPASTCADSHGQVHQPGAGLFAHSPGGTRWEFMGLDQIVGGVDVLSIRTISDGELSVYTIQDPTGFAGLIVPSTGDNGVLADRLIQQASVQVPFAAPEDSGCVSNGLLAVAGPEFIILEGIGSLPDWSPEFVVFMATALEPCDPILDFYIAQFKGFNLSAECVTTMANHVVPAYYTWETVIIERQQEANSPDPTAAQAANRATFDTYVNQAYANFECYALE